MDEKTRKRVILLSILFHILLLLIWEGAELLNIFGTKSIPQPPPAEPIVFDLQQPSQQPREVIQTPEDAETTKTPKNPKFLSDKNALARNAEKSPDLKVDEAFSKGDYDSHDLPPQNQPVGEPPRPREQEKREEKEDEEENEEVDIREATDRLLKEFTLKPPSQSPPGARDRAPGVQHDQQLSRADKTGGISFNTYDWDFAPYMLALKNRIQRNIFPPDSFSKFGIINGNTLLRFKIYPDGRLEDLQVLKYIGHKSLMVTSSNAVEVSAPFPELPSNFPEPFLVVTGKFVYFVKR
ncbi:MAG: TonB C-terminal domain-containing protein [bacterium]|nr:TonB C-terminal domain-containing protein [bacterium]